MATRVSTHSSLLKRVVMRIVIQKRQVRLLLAWTQRVLLTGGIALLGYCGFVAVDAWSFQRWQSRILDSQVNSLVPLAPKSPAAQGGLIGRIEVPRLGLSAVLLEGTEDTTLRRAVGHIAGTPLPGQIGNIGIAGHRDTFFRPLRNVRKNDVITLTASGGEYHYRVVSTKLVSPADVAVLDSDQTEVLTLVTCYPFYFIGPAPKRFIVRAKRVGGIEPSRPGA